MNTKLDVKYWYRYMCLCSIGGVQDAKQVLEIFQDT